MDDRFPPFAIFSRHLDRRLLRAETFRIAQHDERD